MPGEDISSFARLDFGRKARTGFGETVFEIGRASCRERVFLTV